MNEINLTKEMDLQMIDLAKETLNNGAAMGQILNLYLKDKIKPEDSLAKVTRLIFETKLNLKKHLQGILSIKATQDALNKQLEEELNPENMTDEEYNGVMTELETQSSDEEWDL